jgi:hypothetical protein
MVPRARPIGPTWECPFLEQGCTSCVIPPLAGLTRVLNDGAGRTKGVDSCFFKRRTGNLMLIPDWRMRNLRSGLPPVYGRSDPTGAWPPVHASVVADIEAPSRQTRIERLS